MKTKMKKMMWRWSLVTTVIIGLFWVIWYLIAGEVPVTQEIQMDDNWIINLPIGISRWWDIIIGPIWSMALIFLWGHTKDKDNVLVGIVIGMVFGLVFGLGFGLVVGLVVGLGFGLVVGLGFGLVFGLGPRLVRKLNAVLGIILDSGSVWVAEISKSFWCWLTVQKTKK